MTGSPRHARTQPALRPYVMRQPPQTATGYFSERSDTLPAYRQPVGPFDRAIVVVDIVDSTSRPNPVKLRLCQRMYGLLQDALRVSGIDERSYETHDRGDGALLLVRIADDTPKTRLLDTLIPTLSWQLGQHNATAHELDRFTMRAVVHAGLVHYDRWGPRGEAIDIACRLLDSPELKTAARMTNRSLTFAVSGDIYHSVVKHDYDGIDKQLYRLITTICLGGNNHNGWAYIGRRMTIPALVSEVAPPRSQPRIGSRPPRHRRDLDATVPLPLRAT